jgi:hypothetical protein
MRKTTELPWDSCGQKRSSKELSAKRLQAFWLLLAWVGVVSFCWWAATN